MEPARVVPAVDAGKERRLHLGAGGELCPIQLFEFESEGWNPKLFADNARGFAGARPVFEHPPFEVFVVVFARRLGRWSFANRGFLFFWLTPCPSNPGQLTRAH